MIEFNNKQDLRNEFYKSVFKKIIWKENLSHRDREIFSLWVKTFKPNMSFFEHYKDKRILFELVKILGSSELCINEDIRWLLASKIDSLLYHIYFYKILEYDGENAKKDKIHGLTLYKGLANFKNNRPFPPHNIEKKREWQNNFWTGGDKKFMSFVESYNFVLDLDGKTFQDSYKDAKKVFKLLDKFKVRFAIYCSGKKGFHIQIPYSEFKEMFNNPNPEQIVDACRGLADDLTKHLKLKKTDMNLYMISRYTKLPYCIDARNNRVILPLSNEEFLDFDKNYEKYMSLEYCHSLKDLGNRGIYIDRPSNKQGFINLINYLDKEIK